MAAMSDRTSVTALLQAWRAGDEKALSAVMPIVHDELRKLARRSMAGERSDHTLQVTALVNEAYLRLVDLKRMQWQDRAHFFAMSARLMRRILVDHARARRYDKRGGGVRPVSLDEALHVAADADRDLVALDEALAALAATDERKARVVELRFFGGLTIDEASAVLHVSPETVGRDWRLAKAWLARELGRGNRDAG
jgi:RNA polymerase sigma-70 factor (ECF subfamily)